MTAYAIGRLTMRDPSWTKEYMPRTAELVQRHGGRYIVRGGASERLEGEGKLPDVMVVIEFPSMAAARAWYNDSDYEPMIKLRQSGSELDFVLVDGV